MTPRIGLEVVKLLLQQAWADHVLVPQESAYLRRLALQWCPESLDVIDAWLDGAIPLPPPDIGAVMNHKEEVMRALAAVTVADGIVHPEEQAMLKMVAELLDV